MNSIRTRYSGKCPHTGMTKSLGVTFSVLYIAEDPAPKYKKMGFSCDGVEGCTCLDEYGSCPLFIQAPDPH
jgi:hypothetical protein